MRRYAVRAHESIAHAAQHYRSDTPGVPAALEPRRGRGRRTRGTATRCSSPTAPGHFSARALSESQHFEHLQVINDFEAVGHAVGALRADDLKPIGPQRLALPMNQGVCAIVGVGTGLGVGGVVANAGRVHRARHRRRPCRASRPPTNAPSKLLRWLRKKYGRVSAERVLSGAGLANIYLALVRNRRASTCRSCRPRKSPRAPPTAATPNCVEAVGLFCELLGSFAGDLALTLGAWQGVLISGAMLQHFDRADARAPRARRVRIQGPVHARDARHARSKPFPIRTSSCSAPRGSCFNS